MTPSNFNRSLTQAPSPEQNQSQDIKNPNYILAPPNNIVIKLIHAEKAVDLEPLVDLTLEGLNLEFKLSKTQLAQIVLTLNAFYSLERQRLMALYRPEVSVKQDPRAWWKYAFLVISGIYFNLQIIYY